MKAVRARVRLVLTMTPLEMEQLQAALYDAYQIRHEPDSGPLKTLCDALRKLREGK